MRTTILLLGVLWIVGCSWGDDVGNQDWNEPGDVGYLDVGFGITPDERYLVGATEDGSSALLHFVDTATGDITLVQATDEDDDKRIVFSPDGAYAWFMSQGSYTDGPETWSLIDLETLHVVRERTFDAAFWGTRLTTDGELFAVAHDGVVYVVDGWTLEHTTVEAPTPQHRLFEADWVPGTHRLVISWTVDSEFGGSRQETSGQLRELERERWTPDGSGPMLPPVDALGIDRRWLDTQDAEITAYDVQGVDQPLTDPVARTWVWESQPSMWWGVGYFGMHPGGKRIVVPLEATDLPSEGYPRDSLLVLDENLQTVTRVAGRGPVGFTPDGSTLVAYDFTEAYGDVDDVYLLLYDMQTWHLERVELKIGIPAYYITPDGASVLLFSYYDIFSTGHENGLLLYDTTTGLTVGLDDSAGRHVNEAVITPDGSRVYFLDWTDDRDTWYGLFTIDLVNRDVDRVPVDFQPFNINILPSHGRLVMSERSTPQYYFMGEDSWTIEMFVDASGY